MSTEYQKINTLFLRDEHNIIIPDRLTSPEFGYLKDMPWEATEKIDGTNIRVIITKSGDSFVLDFKGRTDKANIPAHLLKKLHDLFDNVDFNIIFPNLEDGTEVILYGEGYGVKIQKGGNYIKNDVNFILFDVRIGRWWLQREACEDIAAKVNIPIVPLIGYMTLSEAIDFVKRGFKSIIAENTEYEAEGLVLKTPVGLLSRNGERIITKIKTCDFRKYMAKYGDGPANQTVNPNYNK